LNRRMGKAPPSPLLPFFFFRSQLQHTNDNTTFPSISLPLLFVSVFPLSVGLVVPGNIPLPGVPSSPQSFLFFRPLDELAMTSTPCPAPPPQRGFCWAFTDPSHSPGVPKAGWLLLRRTPHLFACPPYIFLNPTLLVTELFFFLDGLFRLSPNRVSETCLFPYSYKVN